MKRIKSRIAFHNSCNVRDVIRRGEEILNIQCDEDEFDKILEMDTISLDVGDHTLPLYVSPETWDFMEEFVKKNICHMIQSCELDKYLYYRQMFEKYAKELGTNDFVY